LVTLNDSSIYIEILVLCNNGKTLSVNDFVTVSDWNVNVENKNNLYIHNKLRANIKQIFFWNNVTFIVLYLIRKNIFLFKVKYKG
jgi:hypothetical protein